MKLAVRFALGHARAGIVLAATFTSSLSAADPKSTATEERIATVSTQAKQFVEQCEITTGGAVPAAFVLQREPILRWSNPTAGAVYGDIFLYTHTGRPAALVSYYRWFTPEWGSTIEVSSLHNAPLAATAGATTFWKPQSAELNWEFLPNVDRPAGSANARLTQLRRIAGEFSVNLIDTRANEAGVRRSLRRLPQPVFRYPVPSSSADYLDGALFAFVEGTDPEVLLLVEAIAARPSAAWRYSFARLNRDAIQVTRQEQIVWTAPYLDNPSDRSREPYSTFSADLALKPVR